MSLGSDLIGLIFDTLRQAERDYQERRQSAPPQLNRGLACIWFWIILGTGVVLPFTIKLGFQLQSLTPRWGFQEQLYSASFLFVLPFAIYAMHSSKRLLHDRSQQRPVIGGLVGISAVYIFFYLSFVPWTFASSNPESSDVHGIAMVMTVFFLFLIPLLGLGALVLGRKLATPRQPDR
jgi:hypothetical protein